MLHRQAQIEMQRVPQILQDMEHVGNSHCQGYQLSNPTKRTACNLSGRCHKFCRTWNMSVIHIVRATNFPSPRSEQLATFLEACGKFLELMLAFCCVGTLRPPISHSLALRLCFKSRSWPVWVCTNVGCRPLQIVKTRSGNIKMRFAVAAAI